MTSIPQRSGDSKGRSQDFGDDSDKAQEKAFRAALERARLAVLFSPDLSGAETKIALLMVERSNRDEYLRGNRLVSWLGEGTLSVCARISPDGAKKARRNLKRKGFILTIHRGGARPRDTSVVVINEAWVENVWAAAERDGLKAAWDGKSEKRGSLKDWKGVQADPLSEEDGGPCVTPSLRSEGGTGGPAKGVQADPLRGAVRTPDSLDVTPLMDSLERHSSAASEVTVLEPKQEQRPLPLGVVPIKLDRRRGGQSEAIDQAFEEFCRHYPLKTFGTAKTKAATLYRRAVISGSVSVGDLLAAVMRYAASDKVKRGIICSMCKWLEEERWRETEVSAGPEPDKAGLIGALARIRERG